MDMLRPKDTRPHVMVIHPNSRVARFFEGVLRNGCRVVLFGNCAAAMRRMKRRLPDLILCERGSMMGPDAKPFRDLLRELDLAQPPTVPISADRFEAMPT